MFSLFSGEEKKGVVRRWNSGNKQSIFHGRVPGDIQRKFHNDPSLIYKFGIWGGIRMGISKDGRNMKIPFITRFWTYRPNFESIKQICGMESKGGVTSPPPFAVEGAAKFETVTLWFDLHCGTRHTDQFSTWLVTIYKNRGKANPSPKGERGENFGKQQNEISWQGAR